RQRAQGLGPRSARRAGARHVRQGAAERAAARRPARARLHHRAEGRLSPERRGGQPMKDELERLFAPGGPLAAAVPGFKRRPQQLEMAQAIRGAIERLEVLVAEAGTGTGKTFAYLAPALLAGGKVIVSTGTKTLQDQLFDRD